ncbi:Midasin [Phytophthora rubi]|uniref:Midasin n=1 Tax=Phytophthora rubi TaxID=129364 RepID=A0A6A3PGV7_9STRA|nr:Midasin [Phytophthora rubi]
MQNLCQVKRVAGTLVGRRESIALRRFKRAQLASTSLHGINSVEDGPSLWALRMAQVDGHDATRAAASDQHDDATEQRQVSVGRLRAGLRQFLTAARSSSDSSLQHHPAFQVLAPTVEEQFAATAQLQELAACLVHRELRVLVVKHLRPFLLDLMVRVTDPTLVLYEQEQEQGEQYSECADSMKRSELLAATLAELLTYLPATSTLAQQYFETAPCFFTFADVVAAQKQQSDETLARLRRIAKTAFLLLRARPTELTTLWNWTPFFPLSFHDDTRVRWYAARATALVLRMGNAQRNDFLKGLGVGEDAAVSGDCPAVRQIELELHSEDTTRQEQLIELSVYQEQDSSDDAESQPVPFHDSLQNIFGVVVPTSKLHQQRQVSSDDELTTEPLVPTPSTKRNLQSLAIALGLKRPILVAGPGGCGKTATIRELARLSGNGDMVELHLDDQIDSKTLLGSYVCTDVPGEFTWQPGALTTAVLAGRWVVIEDIDRAPFEVLAALMPLLETREMVLPGRGELLVAHSNFQIFGTTTHGHQMPKGFQESVWTSVGVAPLADNEIEQIMLTRFAKIPRQVVSKIMTTYNAVSGNASEEIGGPVQLWKETRRNYGRDFCLRDLLKWCKRIYRFCYYAAGTTHENASSSHDYITEDERMRIVVEALDVFCGGIRDPKTRLHSACALAAIWEVQAEKIEYYLEQHKPHVTFNTHEVEFGRVHLPTLSQQAQLEQGDKPATSSVVMTGHVLRLLEKMAAIVATCEPALLIGETGCGKTTIIQHMAAAMGQRLVVQNLNIQSDSSDLVGGFKPVEIHLLARPLYMDFVDLFTATFSQKNNAGFLNVVRIALEHKDWKKLVKGMRKAIQMATSKLQSSSGGTSQDGEKSEGADGSNKMAVSGASTSVLVSRWDTFEAELVRFERQKEQAESHFAFSFVEGVLVKALREGHWVLLDEINLASSDTLERISTLLEHETSAFSLTERGDVEVIRPHPNFRLFGAMNPSTDVGKKDLPPSLRNRFTEIYVDECVNPSDLQMVVHHQFKEITGALVPETVEFYLEARKQADLRLSDGARHKPRYSLRTLSQALHITRILIQRGYGTSRAMFEGFCSSFCTQLEMESRQYLERLIKNTFAKTIKARELTRSPPCPGGSKKTSEFVLVSSYWVRKGEFQPPRDDSLPDPVTSRRKFVLTKSVEENLRHVSRAALIGKYPVLLQGPTSAGKTSLIGYLAARIGQKCVRINNHEHTDIQEYMGSYVSDSNGKLAFKEGVLVEAVRKGWWIILDELNLAPSEVLEALNRLLDDNRELFLPETQETVKPHPKFMLFATQNPPGLYGGRKVLSRAFRNRFLEIQVDEVASSELQTILQERSSLPPSYCGILIDIMRQLQLVRQQSSVFAGKSGFITTRDLLRWAERRPATKQALAEEGYCLLAERLRKDEEKQVVKQVLEKKCNVKIDLDALYYRGKPRESNLLNENGEIEQETVWGTKEQFERVQAMVEQAIEEAATGKASSGEPKSAGNAAGLEKISVTKSLRRLFALVGRCLQNEEPVLLVGETGCGKTTVCQLYSLLFSQPLHILNCHQHTETSDFLGCLRPVRGKEKTAHELEEALVDFLTMDDGCIDEQEVEQRRADMKSEGVAVMLTKYESARSSVLDSDLAQRKELVERIDVLRRRFQSIFEWADGPLVESMKNGDLILIDEVNLAEDAVLERLNSVLEPSRTLLLAEKGGDQVEEIVAHSKWRVMATMNPGGDFGKRELSPALRNRFTEIWVPAISDLDDIATIIRDRLVGPKGIVTPSRALPAASSADMSSLCNPILSFVKTFNEANGGVGGCGAVTLRDILSWINFITSVVKKQSDDSSLTVTAWTAFVQGAALSILDGLGLGSDKALHTSLKARDEAYHFLLALVPDDDPPVKQKVIDSLNATSLSMDNNIDQLNSFSSEKTSEGRFGISPFLIPRGPDPVLRKPAFSLKAPTTMSNLYRVLRAMQVSRPIILEGSPGVGKTSLISALAAASGHRLVRINLSEQTDISDLFGSDLPAASSPADDTDDKGGKASQGGARGMFEWCDGVFLRALKAGDWVLLDELNLASQSVLEGLNSCLDHRGSVYIPELDREFECPPTFRVFAAQNPLRQGGGRKGLPKSFLNRFTRVFVETLHEQDLIHIASSMYPTLHCAVTETNMSDSALVGQTLLERMIGFNRAVHEDTMVKCRYGRFGAPWEFNLRDVFRFCDLLKQHAQLVNSADLQLQALSYYVNFIYVERMRSARDRELISRRFEEFFGVKPMDLDAVSLRMSASFVEIGNALLKRQGDMQSGRVAPPLFNFLLKPMEALVHCVNMSWPALLVGPPASGKTSSVRLLAALSGNTLHELGMSAGTDATELLGCFEQVDVGRKLRDIKKKIQVVYEKVLQQLMLSSATIGISQKKKTSILKKANRLSSTWWALITREKYYSENASPRSRDSSRKAHKSKKLPKGHLDEVVVDLMKDIVGMLQKTEANSEEMLSELSGLLNDIDSVVQLSKSKSIASCFEWVDGTLIQAMEKGEWVLLDNVNFCSSSVLDRLNSLMETGGEMLINECGIINGKLRVIKPHKNFRIFLAMDAQYSEVSRAMRNRCVEIALAAEDSPRLDLIKIPLACGIPGFALSQAFQGAHERVVTKLGEFMVGAKYGRINRRHLENWSLLASAELSRGVPPLNAIAESFQRVYGDGLLAQLGLSQEVLELFTSAFQASQENSQKQRVLPMVACPSTFVLCQQSESFVLQRDVAYLEHLVLSSQKLEDDNATDLQLSWLAPEVGITSGEDTAVADGDSNLDAWLKCVALRCQRGKAAYSQRGLEAARSHLSSRSFFGHEGENKLLAVTLAPFALRQIVEVASTCSNNGVLTADRLLFALEKIARGATGNADTLRSIELLARYLQSMTKTELYADISREIEEVAQRLSTLLGTSTELPPIPVYLAANHAIFLRLQSLVAERVLTVPSVKPELDSVWESMLGAQRQLEMLDGVEWLRFCEQEQYQQVDTLFAAASSKNNKRKTNKGDSRRHEISLNKLSVLQQSYAVHKYHADRSNVENELIFLVHPLLSAFNAFLGAFVRDFPKFMMESEFFAAVQAVLRDRFEFSIQLRVPVFEWTHFLIHWQWLKKSLLRLAKLIEEQPALSAPWKSSWNDLLDMSQRMQETIEKIIGCGSRKNVLWKKGGHSLLPSNAELWKAEYLLNRLSKTFMQVNSTSFSAISVGATEGSSDGRVDVLALLFGGVASMEAAMKSGKLDVSSLFFVDVDARKEVLHALCAFSYLAQEQTRGKSEPAKRQSLMAEELFKLPSVLLKKLREKQSDITKLVSKKTLYLSEIEDNADSHVDLLSEEDSRIGKDAPILLFDMKESAVLMDRIVTFQLSPLLEHALARRELQAITELVRVLNNYRLYKSDLSRDRYVTVVKSISHVLKLFEGIVEELLRLGLRDPASFYAFQDIVWCGHTFVSLDMSSEDQPDQAVELDKFTSVVQSHLNGVLFGFHQFLRCNSFNQVDLISLDVFDTRKKLRKANKRLPAVSTDIADHAQVIAGYPRLFQAVQSAVVLKNIAEVDLEESMCPTSEAQMRAARLEKIKSHYATEQTQAGKMMPSASFSFVRELFVATVLAFESTFQHNSGTQWKEIQSLLHQFADNPLTFDAKDQAALLKALRTSTDSTFESLVDPLVAPLMTSVAMEAQLEHNDQSIMARAIGESMVTLGLWRFALLLPSSPVDPVTKPLVKKENLLNRLAMLTMQDAASLSINRLNPLPTSSTEAAENASRSLRELYGQVVEVSAFAIQRYQPSTLRRDSEADKLAALLSTARSTKCSQQRKRELLRELEMFQQTSESFLAQMSKKFGECFRDILEPVAAAIYCVKEGVALVTWSLYQQLKEASLKDQQKETLALSLVQFPSALRVDTVDQSWRGIQLMLQTVGTPGTSIMFGSGVGNKRKVEVALLDVALAKMEFLFRETVNTSRMNRDVDSMALDTALSSSKTLFDLFLTKWQEQKEREEQKRIEEEELFKYKIRQLDLDTEEELLEKEYREQFPDYSGRDFEAFLSPEQAAAASSDSAALPSAADMDVLITDKIMQRLCETHMKLYAETSNSKIAITKQEIVSTFARAFSLAVKLRKSLNASASTSIESAVASSGVLAASLVQARLGSSVSTKKGAVPSFQSLNSDYIEGIDFHRDPLIKEVVLVAEPLQRLMVKVQSLLAQWPDHAILQQLVLIADRIRNFEISSPLVRTLTGVELLLRKAQEWEMYAAKAYSISDELDALSALVTRWRKLELYSWPHLLYVKEKQHRFAAQKTWINMYSLLTAQFESDADMSDNAEVNPANPQNLQWLHLNHVSKWLFTPLSENRADAQALSDAARESAEKQREFMSRLFETLDAYIRSCPIGQYETRLLVVYSFCAQLFMELWSPSQCHESSNSFASNSSKYALANMLYHLYRYYGQHLGYLERQWSGLKAPIQRKLVEFVKICRWDEQTYYSLAESAEKSHRKLMKFVRNYDAVLTVSMQTVIDASTDSGIAKEGGFVGIQSTKAELAGLDDGVVVPKDVEHNEDEDALTSSADGEATDNANKKTKVSTEEDLDAAERPPALRLIHTSAPSTENCEDDGTLQLSSYATKLPALSKRIAKYTQKHILSDEQIERRQQVRELCEDLCETIFYRMAKLQKATGLPKGAKKKALIDLLSELKTQGMAYHRLQLPAEQQQIQQLFELDVPDVENCIYVDELEAAVDSESLTGSTSARGLKGKKKRGKKKSKQTGGAHQSQPVEETLTKNSPMWLWQRADGYYYRFLGQLASLRYTAVTSFSHDLSTSETERMSGYAENMLFTMLQQRQILHATSLSHEKLVDGLATLKLMKQFKANYLSSDSEAAIDPQAASKWQAFQQTSVVSLRHTLRELEISVLQILQQSSENTSVVMDVRQLFQRIFVLCDAIQNSFADSAGLAKSLGVPAIPHRAVNASEDAGGDAAIVSFARPSKRVYGVSPVVARSSEDHEAQKLPVAVEVLKSNAARFGEIQSLLANTSAAFGTVTAPSCFEAFLVEYAGVVRDDCRFAKTLAETSDISLPSIDEKRDEEESAQALAMFSEHYDKLVETVLVSIQDLTKISKEAQDAATSNEEDEEEQSLRDQLATLSTMVKDSRVNHVASQLAKLLELLQYQYAQLANTQSTEWRGVFLKSLALLECFEPSLIDVRGISRQLLVDFLVAHKSVMKLDFVLVRIFRNLFQHGFCRTDDEKNDEGDGGAGNMQFQDDVEGTGMGEGEGKKDVSNEIEDEEQLLGLQGDQQEEPEPPADQKPEDTGLEMQNDFEGTMQDVPDDEKEDQDENEDEEEELDREMGEFDQDDENVVDEKMWGEDSDDDEDNIDKDKEKFEEESKVEGEALEDEVRGKDGDEEEKNEPNKKEDDKQKPQLDPSDDKGADDDKDDGEDGDEDGEDGDEEKMEEVNDDFEDKYEEHHDVDPTEREEGHGEDEAEEEHGDELPEDMQLDNDADDGDDEGDAEGDNPDDENMDKLDDVDDETADDADGEETAGAEEDEDAEEEKEEEQLDSAVQLGGGGLEDEPEQAEEKEEEDAEQAEAPESAEEEQAASTVAGTQSKDGQNELEADEQEAEDQEMEEADAQEQEQNNDDSSNSRAQKQSSSNDQDAKHEWKPQSQVESNPEHEQPREKRRDRREPNPYRNAQEAQEHWKKRVEMVDRTEEEKEQDTKSSEKQEKAAEMTTAEFVDDDEEMEDVEHALAAADENQVMNQPRTEEEEDNDVEKKEDEEKNPGNGATAMEVDEEEEKKEKSKEEKEQNDTAKPVKQEPKPDSAADDDNANEEEQKQDEQEMKPENATAGGEHELLDEEAEHALPSRLRDLDLTNSIQDQDEGDEDEARAVKLLSPDEVAALRDELDSFIANWSSQAEQERGADLWAKYTALTSGASQRLCEQLRLVLEPMLRAKLEGDFRTGKRINMRKVIPYIASQFRKDKIWLRRTRPSKRQYQVMLAIDDSESMADNHAGRLALEALATLCKGMTQLEVGELSVVKFGQELELLHAFDTPFTDDAGSRLIGRFGFQQKKTNMVQTLDTILQLLETAKQSSAASSSTVEFTQIVFLISDGRFDSDGRVRIRKLIETALERQQLIVLLIVDQGAAETEGSNIQQQTSILDTQSVSFEKGKVRMVPYLENYPFPYYVLLPTSAMLPEILSDSLRQWFEMLQAKS